VTTDNQNAVSHYMVQFYAQTKYIEVDIFWGAWKRYFTCTSCCFLFELKI